MLRRIARMFRGALPEKPPPHPRTLQNQKSGKESVISAGKSHRAWKPELVQDSSEDPYNVHDEDIDAALTGLRDLANVNAKNEKFAGNLNTTTTDKIRYSYDDAEPSVRDALENFGDNVEGLIEQAGQYYKKNDHFVAVGIWKAVSSAPYNDPTAAYSYGMCLQEGVGVDEADPKKAAKFLARAARRGHPWAQYALAHAFHQGNGVKKDEEEALTLYKLAAQNGIPPAPFNVANMYAAGQGTEVNDETAIEWYKRAANLGDPKAQFALGARYCSGRGVDEDWEVGYDYHIAAAETGYAPAQFNVGAHFFLGNGVDQDLESAALWFQKAADQGMPQAQVNLARMLLDGYGVAKDKERALSLLSIAADRGKLEIAKEILDKVLTEEPDDEAKDAISTTSDRNTSR